MNGLSLCSGGGSLDLGVEIAFPKYRCIAAVENNPEAARVFKLRYPAAKVFEDVLRFDGRPFDGIVDCVVAGWPCQPHSVAGRREGTSDERWIWGDIARILGECKAPLFIGENVSGLLRDADSDVSAQQDLDEEPDDSMGGMGTVLRDLASMGYRTAWGSLRASDVGAAHGRARVFFLACREVADAGCAGPLRGASKDGFSPAIRYRGGGQAWSEPASCGIDLICGGFPCQDISIAGKGAGIEGSRSGLWSEYA